MCTSENSTLLQKGEENVLTYDFQLLSFRYYITFGPRKNIKKDIAFEC